MNSIATLLFLILITMHPITVFSNRLNETNTDDDMLQDDQARDEGDHRRLNLSWGASIALILIIILLSLFLCCMCIFIFEIREHNSGKELTVELKKFEPHEIAIQTQLSMKDMGIQVNTIVKSPSPEPIEIDTDGLICLDDIYVLKNEKVGRLSRIIMSEQKPSMKLSAVKLFNSLEDYNERLAFYNMMNDDENQSVLNVQPKQFVPELYHYGKITYDGAEKPAIAVEAGKYTLHECLKYKNRGKFFVFSEKSIFYQVCKSVKYLHDKSIVHGNLSTYNAMFFGNRWKIIDFATWTKLNHPMKWSYCPYTAAPEVMKAWYEGQGEDFVLPASFEIDIWSLGLIAWEIVTKSSLLDPNQYSEERLIAMSYGDIPYPWEATSQLWKTIKSPSVQKIISNCLHRDPAHRWSLKKIIQYLQFWSDDDK